MMMMSGDGDDDDDDDDDDDVVAFVKNPDTDFRDFANFAGLSKLHGYSSSACGCNLRVPTITDFRDLISQTSQNFTRGSFLEGSGPSLSGLIASRSACS